MKNHTSTAKKAPPFLIRLAFTQCEIQTIHKALERDAQIAALFGHDLHTASWFLARSLEVEIEEHLRTDRTGVLCWLNGIRKEAI